jgi:hypothetical protein
MEDDASAMQAALTHHDESLRWAIVEHKGAA